MLKNGLISFKFVKIAQRFAFGGWGLRPQTPSLPLHHFGFYECAVISGDST